MRLVASELVTLLITLALVALAAALYFLPALVAHRRRKRNVASIFVVNLFFGWTLLGWVGCLAWALALDYPAGRPGAPPR